MDKKHNLSFGAIVTLAENVSRNTSQAPSVKSHPPNSSPRPCPSGIMYQHVSTISNLKAMKVFSPISHHFCQQKQGHAQSGSAQFATVNSTLSIF
jgi:hypothetical protein